jgi:FKBP-type peptidyl-prolyl cis-trans isomerase SlyD
MGIEFGDIIAINFVERCDGEVLGTNIEQVARDNEIYDEDEKYIPSVINVGHDVFPDGLYDEFIGKEAGAKGTVILPPKRAYGERSAEKIHSVNKKEFRELPKIGTYIYNSKYGKGLVVGKVGSQFVVDFNNPLAGKDIEYEYYIHEIIKDPSEQFSRMLEILILGKHEASFENGKGTIRMKLPIGLLDEWNEEKALLAAELFVKHPSLQFLEFCEEYKNLFNSMLYKYKEIYRESAETNQEIDDEDGETDEVDGSAKIKLDDIISISFIECCDGKVLKTNIEEIARDNGIYDEDNDYIPTAINVGDDNFPEGLHDELIGKEVGAKGKVTLPPEKAYGERSDENIHSVDRKELEEGTTVGSRVFHPEYGEGVVINKIGKRFIVDCNDPHAGKNIEYEYEIHEIITDPSEQFLRLVKGLRMQEKAASFENGKGTINIEMPLKEILVWNIAKTSFMFDLFKRQPSLETLVFCEVYEEDMNVSRAPDQL